ncbi:unnamed protein product [Withania somnifera]
MDGGDRVIRRRKSLTERLGLKGIGCCGSTWGIMPTTFNVTEDDNGNHNDEVMSDHIHTLPETLSATTYLMVGESNSRMNLAAALAAERHFRADSNDNEVSSGSGLRSGPNLNSGSLRPNEGDPRNVPGTPTRMSLMRLLEETEVYEGELLMEDEGVGSDSVCCVCMRRKKGAAFIPCGHTFCRVCSRELWVNRGCCPLCNRSILEILDIY